MCAKFGAFLQKVNAFFTPPDHKSIEYLGKAVNF